MAHEDQLDALRSGRIAVVALDDGGVALDTVTGAYYRLNAVGGMVLRALSDKGALDDATTMLVARFGIDRALAERDVMAMLAGIGQETGPTVRRRDLDYAFEREDDQLWLTEKGRRVLAVSVDGSELRSAPGATADELARCLLWASASVMALRGVLVLHASCVGIRGEGLAIAGESGAGKTTTARSFVKAGAQPIAEDTLIVAEGGAVVGGEAALREWVEQSVPALLQGPIGTAPLHACLDGARMPLSAVLVIEAARRAGDTIARTALGPTDALVRMIDNVFWGPKGRDSWGPAFRQCAALTAVTPIFDASAPQGLDALERAARDYISTYTSKR